MKGPEQREKNLLKHLRQLREKRTTLVHRANIARILQNMGVDPRRIWQMPRSDGT